MSEKFLITGKNPLRGEVEIRGSKNAASKMMVASLLTEEPCMLENIPLSGEIEITRELCENVGSRVRFLPDHRCAIETGQITTSVVPELSRKNRIPILALGPLLHRKGFAEVPVLGGDPIGHRPINLHIDALEKMGVHIERRANSFFAEAREIRGAEIEFPFPSVGATENVILTAVLAKGETQIKNAAVEPEILDLIGFLKKMGAKIFVDETGRLLRIEGVERLGGAQWRVMPDRNEVVSFASAAYATGGDVAIKNIDDSYLLSFLEKIKEMGGGFAKTSDGIRFFSQGGYRSVFVETAPHPGFMTDWQQPLCVLLTVARGASIIHETIYEDRFGYIKDLNQMGADIKVSDECPRETKCRFSGQKFRHTAYVSGPAPLQSTEIEIKDIRAGMAHIIAALSAEGESIISGIEHIERGYERIEERLQNLGADIRRISNSKLPMSNEASNDLRHSAF